MRLGHRAQVYGRVYTPVSFFAHCHGDGHQFLVVVSRDEDHSDRHGLCDMDRHRSRRGGGSGHDPVWRIAGDPAHPLPAFDRSGDRRP